MGRCFEALLGAVRSGSGGLEVLPGLCALLRSVWMARAQSHVPAMHLRQLNPYISSGAEMWPRSP